MSNNSTATTAWANGFGIWHVRVPRNAASPIIAARARLRDELTLRERNVAPGIWKQPIRVPEYDDDNTIVYRENDEHINKGYN